MKFQHIALFAAATAFVAGCSPKNPPSGYNEEGNGDTSLVTTGAGTGAGLENTAPVDPNGLNERSKTSIDNWDGDISKLPPEAIALVVNFGFDKYSVEAGERAKIDAKVAELKGKKIIAAGYTDYLGTEDYNLGLSDKRANSVKSYLGKVGVTDTDIRAYGEKFAAQSGDKNAVAQDRKVVIIDTSKVK